MGFNLHPISCTVFCITVQTMQSMTFFFYSLQQCGRTFWCRLTWAQRSLLGIEQMEPLQESVFVKHTNGWLINTLQQTVFYCTITHRLVDKRVLHNVARYSSQEQSGAPPRVSLPNLRVSSWLMCNWLDEWVPHSANPSKYCLIKHPPRLWLKSGEIGFI